MVDDKQFYISKEKSNCYPNWKQITLWGGQIFHYHPKLNIVYQSERFLLVGYAWQVDPRRDAPELELRNLEKKELISQEDIFELENNWCGRYLLIAENWIYLDASGSLGVFYSKTTISSSLNVLCAVEKKELRFPPIEHRHMPDFIPGMQTHYDDVCRLLPSQIFDIKERKWQTRPLLFTYHSPYSNYSEGVSLLSKYFIHSLQNMNKCFPNHVFWLALTGGRDSRAAMSLLEKAQFNYKTFTLWHENLDKNDYKIAKRLSCIAHKKHRFVRRNTNNYSSKRYEDYRRHTLGMAVDEDWKFYAYRQYQSLLFDENPIVILRSSIWEIANDYYEMVYGKQSQDLSKVFPYINKYDLLYNSITEWNNYVDEDVINKDISFANRVYWELRSGCWLSSIEQSFDMMENIVSLQPANCRLFISLLLAFPAEDRIQKYHENKIAELSYPPFAKIPYDYQMGPDFSLKLKQRIWKYVEPLVKYLKK